MAKGVESVCDQLDRFFSVDVVVHVGVSYKLIISLLRLNLKGGSRLRVIAETGRMLRGLCLLFLAAIMIVYRYGGGRVMVG